MKIIDIGICINNIDPKGMGRIRCIRYNDYVGEKEKSVKYDEWSDSDPFIATPFLPTSINFIPEVGQSVKILNYNTQKETTNQEYIAGPFTTMYDFNSQTFTQQIENTTYGIAVKHKQDIRNTTGEYDQSAQNAFAKESDFGVYGKFGSDILFTENGVQLRGGKLKTKKNLNQKEKEKLISFPLMSDKSANLYLKKFPAKATIQKRKTKKEILDISDLKTIVEYEILSLVGNVTINFYVYRVSNPYGQTFKTNFFSETTSIENNGAVKLINTSQDTTTPTFTIENIPIENVENEIRTTLYTLHRKGLVGITTIYGSGLDYKNLHPLFYRPSVSFRTLTPANNTEKENKSNILNEIYLTNSGPFRSGLIFSPTIFTPTIRTVETEEDILVYEKGSQEQTFGAIKADKIYLLSTDTNDTDKKIDFNKLDKYEISQENYINLIDPRTYSTVRGELLLKFLKALYETFLNHVHNINEPYAKEGFDSHKILQDLYNTLENDILNKSIKVN